MKKNIYFKFLLIVMLIAACLNLKDQGYQKYKVTAYSNESVGKKLNDPYYGITASGKKATQNRTIACSKRLDFGTKVYIKELDKIYICEDRGSAIKGKKIDIYFNSNKEALQFGRQKMSIKIIRD